VSNPRSIATPLRSHLIYRWNPTVVKSLKEGVRTALLECNVKNESVFETEVPGSYELPLAAKYLAMSNTVDVIVCLGTLVKGETMHFEYISAAVTQSLLSVSTPCSHSNTCRMLIRTEPFLSTCVLAGQPQYEHPVRVWRAYMPSHRSGDSAQHGREQPWTRMGKDCRRDGTRSCSCIRSRQGEEASAASSTV
jgi:hypothetical protein